MTMLRLRTVPLCSPSSFGMTLQLAYVSIHFPCSFTSGVGDAEQQWKAEKPSADALGDFDRVPFPKVTQGHG